MIKDLIKSVIPSSLLNYYNYRKIEKIKEETSQLPIVNEDYFIRILNESLKINQKNIIFIHSSIDRINISFPFFKVIPILLSTVSPDSTIVFPTYPGLTSYKFLKSGNVFDVKKTPTHTGLLNEFARRHKGAIRSLHPTKSVVAIGPLAEELTSEHHLSPYPYDKCSPYYKAIERNALIIGLGVNTTYLSAVHALDDYFKEEFPVMPYHDELFGAKCIDYDRNEVIVKTYAHDMKKMNFDLPAYFKQYFDKKTVEDINIDGMNFFRAESAPMFEKMVKLAKQDITFYKKKHYRKDRK